MYVQNRAKNHKGEAHEGSRSKRPQQHKEHSVARTPPHHERSYPLPPPSSLKGM